MHVEPSEPALFHHGGARPTATVARGERFTVHTLDCFGGRLTSPDQHPREVAPYPFVNPLTGPVCVDGVTAGDVVAIHLHDLELAREWGVATVSPRFGLLASSAAAPTLEKPTPERVWVWQRDQDELVTATADGRELRVPLAPFLGTVGVRPAHGEVFSSVRLGAFGGNLDTPLLRAGTTLLLAAQVDGVDLVVGDGHLAQGDGEVAGTAVEGELVATLSCDVVPDARIGSVPRLVDAERLTSVGWGRPLEEALRGAVADLVSWVAAAAALDELDAYQLVTQSCEVRVANVVNPEYSVTVSIPRSRVPADAATQTHDRLAGGAR